MQRGGSFTSGQDIVRKDAISIGTFFQIKCPLEMVLSFLITNILTKTDMARSYCSGTFVAMGIAKRGNAWIVCLCRINIDTATQRAY